MRAGDNQFRRDLVEALPALRGAAVNFAGDNADDLLQQTAVTALTKEATYTDAGGKFQGWLFSVMRTTFLMSVRSPWTNATSDISDYADYLPVDNDPDRIIEAHDVLGYIGALPAGQARAIGMFAVGYSYAEISQDLGIELGTVRSRVHRARAAIEERAYA